MLRRWIGAGAMLALPGSLYFAGAGVFAWAAALGLREARQGADLPLVAWTIVAALIAAALVAFQGMRLRWVLRAAPRVVPYFERAQVYEPLPHAWKAFRAGRRLATSIDHLDATAERLGVPPLSALGFGDDALRQAVAWHDPCEGLRIVAALRAAGMPPDMDADLALLEAALGSARDQGRRFALIVRLGDDELISPMEMDARQGTFS